MWEGYSLALLKSSTISVCFWCGRGGAFSLTTVAITEIMALHLSSPPQPTVLCSALLLSQQHNPQRTRPSCSDCLSPSPLLPFPSSLLTLPSPHPPLSSPSLPLFLPHSLSVVTRWKELARTTSSTIWWMRISELTQVGRGRKGRGGEEREGG